MTKDDIELKELGRAYREIKAPPDLAPRIVAVADSRTDRRRGYGLPLAAAAAVAGLMVVIPFLSMQERDDSSSLRPVHIPLSKVQGQLPTMSSFDTPNLADIQGLPTIPSRHDLATTEEQPQTRLPEPRDEPTLT